MSAAAAEVWVTDDPRVIEAVEDHSERFHAWTDEVRDAMRELGVTQHVWHARQSDQRVVGIAGPREVVEALDPEWAWRKTKGYATPNRAAAKRWLKALNDAAPGPVRGVGLPGVMMIGLYIPGRLLEVLDGRAWCSWSSRGVWDELFDGDDPKDAYSFVFEHGWSEGRLSEYYAAKEVAQDGDA